MRRGLLLLLSVLLVAAAPPGWELEGSARQDYRVSLDRDIVHSGRQSARLAHAAQRPGGFGTLMQTIQASRYQGQRLELSAWVRTEDVVGWAGLWMRVDDGTGQPLTFDNMQDRPLRGTTAWQRVSVVLEIPAEARTISLGVLLSGSGVVWMDDLALTPVAADVPLTDRISTGRAGPQNLSFD